MVEWLDTQTKALLQRAAPEKMSPPDTATFSLVLLAIERQKHNRVVQTLCQIFGVSLGTAHHILDILANEQPKVLKHGLSYPDALMGQFDLVCCDCISVFLADEVVEQAPKNYLSDLYSQLRQSSEFEIIHVRIESIPKNQQGEAFLSKSVS